MVLFHGWWVAEEAADKSLAAARRGLSSAYRISMKLTTRKHIRAQFSVQETSVT